MTAATLEFDNVSVAFQGVKALTDVTLTLGEDPVTAIIGPNGAGKTTLLNVATGFIKPTAGTVVFDSGDTKRLAPHQLAKRGVMRTWQGARLFESLSVRDNLVVGAKRGKQGVEKGLADLGLRHLADRLVGNLTLGERLRVVFARTLVAEPKIVLLDEPFAGIEVEGKAEIAALIRDLAVSTGLRVVLIEHDVPTVMSLADRIVVLQAGRLLIHDKPEIVIRDERVIDSYFGEDLGRW